MDSSQTNIFRWAAGLIFPHKSGILIVNAAKFGTKINAQLG